MKHTSLVTILVFVAGLGIGYFARSAVGTLQRKHRHAADLAAIEKLHQKDIEVTLSQDPKGLLEVWTEDGVRLEPGKPPVVGKQAIQADNEKGRAQVLRFKVLSYVPGFKEIQIADGWAYEWGETEAKLQMSPEGPPFSLHSKGLRVMRRQSDGSWKFAVVVGNQCRPPRRCSPQTPRGRSPESSPEAPAHLRRAHPAGHLPEISEADRTTPSNQSRRFRGPDGIGAPVRQDTASNLQTQERCGRRCGWRLQTARPDC